MTDLALGSWFAARARRTPHRPALSFEGTTWNYGQLQDRIERAAAVLHAAGVCPGDRVCYLSANHPSYLETLFACSRLGAIFAPCNPRLTANEVRHIVTDAGPRALVVAADRRQTVEAIRGELPGAAYLVCDLDSEGAPAPGWESLPQAIADAAPRRSEAPLCDDDVAVLMYTSGTTGRPKGAMLTHGNLWWCTVANHLVMDVLADDVTLLVAPLFHVGGLNVTTLVTWQKGGHVLLHRGFDASACLRAIEAHGVATMFAVPTMLEMMRTAPEFDSADLRSLRVVSTGASPVPVGLIEAYAHRRVLVQQGYGLTEAAPTVSYLTPEFALRKAGSAGLAPPLIDIRLIAPDGSEATRPGERGEVCVRGRNVMKGYWRAPQETRRAIDAEGWLHTGDVGERDADGFLYIVDRLKDVIVTGGENVYPAEVERVLRDHPRVRDVAVVGLPDERWGQAVTAIVVAEDPGTVELDDLRSFAEPHLARYKLPSKLRLLDELPRSEAGKVLKKALAEQLTN
jgi:fatty-acyl-CoA synthase